MAAAAIVLFSGGGSAHHSAAQATTVPCTPARPGVERTSFTCGAKIVDGKAVAPANAPAAVDAVIAAANRIDERPYQWGGGHASWSSHGYDCSGSLSYALHLGHLLRYAMVSGEFEDWGEGGIGRWITVFTNVHHAYMVVAGLRFDTSEDPAGENGPRWHTDTVGPGTYVARHPTQL